jgi:hypothetical protein
VKFKRAKRVILSEVEGPAFLSANYNASRSNMVLAGSIPKGTEESRSFDFTTFRSG